MTALSAFQYNGEICGLVLQQVKRCGFVDERVLDTVTVVINHQKKVQLEMIHRCI